MSELIRLPEGAVVWLLVRYRSGQTQIVSGQVTEVEEDRALLVTAAGEHVELRETEVDAVFRLPLD